MTIDVKKTIDMHSDSDCMSIIFIPVRGLKNFSFLSVSNISIKTHLNYLFNVITGLLLNVVRF